MTYRRRTYPEVLDNLLTSLTGGISAEPHPYPPEDRDPAKHYLLKPKAARIVSVYGRRDGQPHLFRADKDYRLVDGTALVWLEGAELPDEGSLILVNYYPESALPILTDIQTGSVVRTLTETSALEIARLHAQLEAVYNAGFVDTATGSSLDQVVALLGVNRIRGGRPAGDLVFKRAEGNKGLITLSAGTRVLSPDGEIEYETLNTVTMAESQTSIRVRARDLEANDGLPADSLTLLPVPIAGVASVTNPAPTVIDTHNETDPELRTRAKNFLHGSERATTGALRQVLALQGVKAEIKEFTGQPGVIQVIPHAEKLEPEQHDRLLRALRDVAPAGILVQLGEPITPRQLNVNLRLSTEPGLLEQDLRAVQREVGKSMEDYFERLEVGADGSLNRLVGLVMGVSGVVDMAVEAIVDSTDQSNLLDGGSIRLAGAPSKLSTLNITDPNLPSLLDVLIGYPENAEAPDRDTVSASVAAALANLNDINSQPIAADLNEAEQLAAQAERSVQFGTFIRHLALPGKDPMTLIPAQLSPYQVTLVVTQAAGLSQTLVSGDDRYDLTSYERLALRDITLAVEEEA